MIFSLKRILPIIAFTLCLQARADESLKRLVPFLSQHCYDCHGAEKQKGEIRLDTLGKDLTKH
ncbi:MAG: c-type cytochrome domain-containing protein, partial [Verrucomicrobiota bacterium]|nr:c-type cytochrome domain-containing protein [Verrucomicrobiota bacterium]